MLKTANKRMRWFLERRSGGGSFDLTILLLLVKETIIFFAFKRGAMAPMAPPWLRP